MAIYKKILNLGISGANNISSILSRQSTLNSQRCAMINMRSLEKKLGLPPKPKRPLTPYIQFTMKQRPILAAQHPEKTPVNLMKKLAEQWRSIDDNDKEKYREDYRNQLEKYTKEMMAYELKLTAEQREMIDSERARLNSNEEKKKMKSRLKELGRPKKPPTPFVLYMVSKLSFRPKDMPFVIWLSNLAKEWTALPPEQKLLIQEESSKLMEQYKTDVILWETKMIRMGLIDVVRSRRLLDMKGKPDIQKREENTP